MIEKQDSRSDLWNEKNNEIKSSERGNDIKLILLLEINVINRKKQQNQADTGINHIQHSFLCKFTVSTSTDSNIT